MTEGGGDGIEFRTASWEALARWDEYGSRRGSERDLLEALLGTTPGHIDDAAVASPPRESLGMRIRRVAEAIGVGSAAGGSAGPTDVHEGSALQSPSLGHMARDGVAHTQPEELPSQNAGVALLNASHVRRLASLLNEAPSATPAPLRGIPQQDGAGHHTESIDGTPVGPPGVLNVRQAGVLLSPQPGACVDSSALLHRSYSNQLDVPSVADQPVAPSVTTPLHTTRPAPHGVQHTQPAQQPPQQPSHRLEQQPLTIVQAVRDANAAWTAATWRLISGLEPQP